MKSCGKYLLLFIFNLGNVTDGAKFRCDYKYCRNSGAWFKYHVIPVTWRDARLMCLLEGAILASPTTPEIRVTMTKSTGAFPIFTGLHSLLTKGNYFTVDGIHLEEIYQWWGNFQPDNLHNNESCIALDSRGQFFDVNCDVPRPYMCYRNVATEITECGTHDPAYELDTRTGHCYKFHTAQRTFERAHFACAAEGGHLAIINSDEEASVIRDIFKTIPGYMILGSFSKDIAFIGFHNWHEDGDWRTIQGQTPQEAGYARWSSGKPSSVTDGKFCGSVYRNAHLNDVDCKDNYAYICEKMPDFPPVCDNNVDDNLNRRNFRRALAMKARENSLTG